MKTLETLQFKDIGALVYSVLEQYETAKDNSQQDDFLGVSIVAPYEVLIGILNHIVKNTPFIMKNIHLADGECNDYWDEWILTIDSDGQIWTQVAKYKTGYIFTEDNVVFVHGNVNSAFVKKNENENLVAFEIGEVDDVENDEMDGLDKSDSKDIYQVCVKCDLDAAEALKIIEDMENRISKINDVFEKMDRFCGSFRW